MTDFIRDPLEPFELRLAAYVRAYTDAADAPTDAAAIAHAVATAHRRGARFGFDWRGLARQARWLVLAALLALTAAAAFFLAGGHPRSTSLILVGRAGHVVAIDPGTAAEVDLGGGSVPVWSPDRSQIASQADGFVIVMNADGSDRHAIDGPGYPVGPLVWSPDGAKLLYIEWVGEGSAGDPRPEFRVTTTTGAHVVLSVAPWKDVGNGAWSPDGTRLALVSRVADLATGSGSLYVVGTGDLATAAIEVAAGNFPWRPRWSPDGGYITYADTDGVHVIRPDGTADRLLVPHPAYPCLSGGSSCVVTFVNSLDWAPDGRRLAYTIQGDAKAYVVDVDSAEISTLFEASGGFLPDSVAWSDDGSQVAVAVSSADKSASAIWLVDADGEHARLLVDGVDPLWDRGPDWW